MTVPGFGTYQGFDAVDEYLAFGVAEFSPYFETNKNKLQIPVYTGYDRSTETCKFSVFFNNIYELNPETTWQGSSKLSTAFRIKTEFNLRDSFASKLVAYYNKGAMKGYFQDRLGTVNTREYVCSVMKNECADQVETPDDCVNFLEALPLVTGEYNGAEGNSQGCRAFHASLAATNPTGHCPHLSFTPIEDVNGDIKENIDPESVISDFD